MIKSQISACSWQLGRRHHHAQVHCGQQEQQGRHHHQLRNHVKSQISACSWQLCHRHQRFSAATKSAAQTWREGETCHKVSAHLQVVPRLGDSSLAKAMFFYK